MPQSWTVEKLMKELAKYPPDTEVWHEVSFEKEKLNPPRQTTIRSNIYHLKLSKRFKALILT